MPHQDREHCHTRPFQYNIRYDFDKENPTASYPRQETWFSPNRQFLREKQSHKGSGFIPRGPSSWDNNESTSEKEEGELEETGFYTYKQRLELVDRVLELDIEPEILYPTTDFANKPREKLIKLPPAKGFPAMLDNYLKEVQSGSSSKGLRHPLEVGKLPARSKAPMRNYEVAGDPWQRTASLHNSSLLSDRNLEFSLAPNVVVPQEKVKEWETSAREEFSIASYTTMFLKSAQKSLLAVQEKIHKRSFEMPEAQPVTKTEWGDLWNDVEDGLTCIDSAGRGVRNIAESTVSDIGSLLMTRRDSWLQPLEKRKIPKEEICNLRHTDLNSSLLFDQVALNQVSEKAEKLKSGRLQDKFYEHMLESSRKDKKESFARRNPRGNKASSTGYNPSYTPSYNPSHNPSYTAPSRGRGRGRGRGSRPPSGKQFARRPAGTAPVTEKKN